MIAPTVRPHSEVEAFDQETTSLMKSISERFKDGAGELRPFVNRVEAAALLTELGLPLAPATMAKQAVRGDGCRFRHWNGRVIYSSTDLIAWARTRLSQPVNNTAAR
jgi:hypothetical protein